MKPAILLCSTIVLALLCLGAADETKESDARLQTLLLQLRELVLLGLEQQEYVAELAKRAEAADSATGAGGATLDDVLRGAKVFASGLAAETSSTAPPTLSTTAYTTATTATTAATAATAKTATTLNHPVTWTSWTTSSWLNTTRNGTTAAGVFSAGWFRHIYARMLTAMPPAAWIAVLTVVGILIIAVLILIIFCCCRMRRDKRRRYNMNDDGPPQNFTYKDLDIIGRKQPPYGVINFSIEYDVVSGHLIITAFSCIGLPKDLKPLDPYVTIRLDVPSIGKSKHQQQHLPAVQAVGGDASERSKVVKNSVNPALNFTRTFKIRDKRLLKNMKVIFEVYDWDIGTRHRMIARRVMNFARLGEKLDDILGRRVEYSRDLQSPVIEEATGPGDICLALCYSDQDKHLWVHIIECKGVFLQKFDQPDLETMPNTYVKLCLSLAGSTKRLTKSTKLVPESRNPYFNEQFIFKIDPLQMLVASLRVTLIHRTDTLRIKRVLGALNLAKAAEKDSLALLHWTEAVSYHGRPQARWHTLITPEAERKLADRKAEAELKKKLEEAEDEAQTDPSATLVPVMPEE